VGSAVAGLIVGLAGTFWPAFALDAASFLVSVALLSRLPAAVGRIEDAHAAAASVGSALAVGLRTIARSRILVTTIGILGVSMLGLGAVNILFVPFVVGVLDVGPVWMGPVEFAQSASMILASGLIGVLARRLSPTSIVTVGIAGIAVTIGLAGAVGAIWQLLVLMFVLGWFVVPLQASIVTILQTTVPDGERGRVMAVLQAVMSAAGVVSMAAAGIAGDALGVREVFFAAGALCGAGFLVALVGFRVRGAVRDSATDGDGDPVPSGVPAA
jgi:predicted MFS family arabinose efflux permease